MRQNIELSDLCDIKVHTVSLGGGIKGFVYVSKGNVPHIFIEESLSPERAAETLAHEIYHLKYDKLAHGIGLNKQHGKFEKNANRFAVLNASRLLALISIST